VLSDTLAALVGGAYGKWCYAVGGSRRTAEGSAVFFLTTILCVAVPLLLLTSLDPPAAILIAVQTALAAALLEAVSPRGSDNVIVPLATYCLLVTLAPAAPDQLAPLLLGELMILALIALLAGRRARSAGGRP
jgi:phytol kinase